MFMFSSIWWYFIEKSLRPTQFELQPHTIPSQDYNQYTMPVMFNAHSSDIINVWPLNQRWRYYIHSLTVCLYMCQEDDNVSYDININISRLMRKKRSHYQVEVAGKIYFLKNLSKKRNHIQPYLKLGLYNYVVRII